MEVCRYERRVRCMWPSYLNFEHPVKFQTAVRILNHFSIFVFIELKRYLEVINRHSRLGALRKPSSVND